MCLKINFFLKDTIVDDKAAVYGYYKAWAEKENWKRTHVNV